MGLCCFKALPEEFKVYLILIKPYYLWWIDYKLNYKNSFFFGWPNIFFFASMKGDLGLFTNLPRELTLDILGRLPIKSIITCKYVCKSWHVIIQGFSPRKPVLTFKCHGPCLLCLWNIWGEWSHYGLMFVRDKYYNHLFIINSMTCEYIKLPLPKPKHKIVGGFKFMFQFRVSRISEQYKIICGYRKYGSWSCYEYTLGKTGRRGLWRRISEASKFIEGTPTNPERLVASYYNGNF